MEVDKARDTEPKSFASRYVAFVRGALILSDFF